jgi:pyruvate dehydrogenase E1 component beta subunit
MNMTFCDALRDGIAQEMRRDCNSFIYGIGVPDHKKIFGTTIGLLEEFGPKRCFDTPLCEDSLLGFGLGAAVNGLRPINVHIRVDFLLLAMNQLVNMVSSYRYTAGGNLKVPITIRAVVGRGWGQGCQHSKSLYSTFAHIPGLKVVIPSTPADAKGLLAASIRDDNPVLVIEHRWLYWQKGEVPEGECVVPIGPGQILKEGNDITVVAPSWMSAEASMAADILHARRGVSVEIIDPRTISPLDDSVIINSVNKTGRCIVAEDDWVHCGIGAEIASRVQEKCFSSLKSPIARIGCLPCPCPTARKLENKFYPNASDIIRKTEELLELGPIDLSDVNFYAHENRFKGPF